MSKKEVVAVIGRMVVVNEDEIKAIFKAKEVLAKGHSLDGTPEGKALETFGWDLEYFEDIIQSEGIDVFLIEGSANGD